MAENRVIDHLLRQARERPGATACWSRVDGEWSAMSWSEYVDEIRRAARALMASGVEPGDRVAVIGFNRREWTVFALGAVAAGGVPVGVYTTNSPSELAYVAGHAEAKVLAVADEVQWEKAAAVRSELPELRRVVMLSDRLPEGVEALSWSDFLAASDGVSESELDERFARISGDDLATLIYTSGTTGTPKGVMLSHDNVAQTAEIGIEMFDLGPDDTNLSYLPLSHIAEQMFTVFIPCLTGGAVYYAESPERVVANLAEVKPTIFFGVPRVWEKMQAGVAAGVGALTGAKRRLATWAQAVGAALTEHRARGTAPSLGLRLRGALADRLVLSKVRDKLGLSRARVCVSGAAPIARHVLEYLAGFGVLVREIYGQSEGSGPTTCNQEGATRFGTVGPVIPRVEMKLGDDGEILVRGPNVFAGYFRDPEGTAEVLIDGWLHSGDLGSVDEDGFLTITGRKKDILITSGGKNIAPRAIEEALERIDLVADAVAIGEGRRFVTALLVLDDAVVERIAGEYGQAPEEARSSAALREHLQTAVDAANAEFARVEQVRAFHVLDRPFSIEAGELTPTLKLKRAEIERLHAEAIEAMYAA